MVYETLFLIGLVGLVAQVALGGLGGHGHGHATHTGHAHTGHAGTHGAGHSSHGSGSQSRAPGWMLDVLSPLTLFSLCLGIGATGLLLRPLRLLNPAHLAFAVLGGLLFYALLVKPLWNFIFRFASEPAKALDGAVAETAEALSHFDATGKGLVRVTVDGQLVRVLAFLDSDDRADAASVQPGDALTILSVDGRANTCRVARL